MQRILSFFGPKHDSASTTTSPAYDRNEQKMKYALRLIKGIKVLDKDEAGQTFDSLTEVASVLDNDKYQTIIEQASEAIKKGEFDKLKALLGPNLYQWRQETNRRINELRWKWVNAREEVDSYAHIFSTVIWFGRKKVLEEYIHTLVSDATIALGEAQKPYRQIRLKTGLYQDQRGRFIYVPPNCHDQNDQFGFINVLPSCYEQTQQTLHRCEQEMYACSSIATKYQQAEAEFTVSQNIYAYAHKLKTLFSKDQLDIMFEFSKKMEPPHLSIEELQQLKKALKMTLSTISQTMSNHLGQLTRQTYLEDGVPSKAEQERAASALSPLALSVVIKEISKKSFKNIKLRKLMEGHIDGLCAETNDLSQILNKIEESWQKCRMECRRLESEYFELISISRREKEEARLIREYKNEVIRDEKRIFINSNELKEYETIVEDALNLNVGACSLFEKRKDSNHFLSLALHACANPDHVFSLHNGEDIRRLNIAIFLIQRGCSVFKLPCFDNQGVSSQNEKLLVTSTDINWHVLIPTLDMMTCITPFSESVRLVLLAYSKKAAVDNSGNAISKKRRQAITRLAHLIYLSQDSSKLEESTLIEKIEQQISHEPRGLLGRSSLYDHLENLITMVRDNELLVIHKVSEMELESQHKQKQSAANGTGTFFNSSNTAIPTMPTNPFMEHKI